MPARQKWMVFFLCSLALGVCLAEGKTYNIRAFGARGGDCLDTAAIQCAIDTAWQAGGGEVVVPEGFFRTGGIRLRTNITLHLLEGAVLEGSWNAADYDILERDTLEPIPAALVEVGRHKPRSSQVASRWNHALIRAYKADNVAIIGEKHSLIDGGNVYDPDGEEKYRGPHAISFWDCTGLTLRGYTVRNSANWAHIVVRCPKAAFDNITVYGGHDGIDIHCCEDTTISHCRFETGDDCIAGFGNVRTRVRDCVFNCPCNDVRFGGTDALFERCRSVRPSPWGHRYNMPVEYKSVGRNHGAVTRHSSGNMFTYYCDARWGAIPKPGKIVFRDCAFDGVAHPFCYDWGNQWGCYVPLEDLTFENCRFTNVREPFKIVSCPETPILVTLRNCHFAAASDAVGKDLVTGAHYKPLVMENVTVKGFKPPKK